MRFADWIIARMTRREPDVVIGRGNPLGPYLLRWFVIPRNRFFNVYLHKFLRSDDDRALHDHPWANCSVLLRGCYNEHTIDAGGVHQRRLLQAGAVRIRWSGKFAHRVELLHPAIAIGNGTPKAFGAPIPCWTLFITGPRYRAWGFHCPDQGWIHWERFTADDDRGAIGKGCDA